MINVTLISADAAPMLNEASSGPARAAAALSMMLLSVGSQTELRMKEGKMATAGNGATAPEDRVLVMTRIFDAPRSIIFKVWTEPQHLVCWWGPRGYTTPVCEMDVRPGGA